MSNQPEMSRDSLANANYISKDTYMLFVVTGLLKREATVVWIRGDEKSVAPWMEPWADDHRDHPATPSQEESTP